MSGIQRDIVIYNQPDCVLPKSFFEGRFPPDVHPDSLDWEQWWDDQTERCKNGWSDGGYKVTGPYYYHLNHKKINMLNHVDKPMIGHPYYSEEDQQLFNDIAEAREDGQGLILLTGRGFGKCLARGTKVLMYNGTLKEVQNVEKGDLLMGPDSKPRKVLGTTYGTDDLYEVVQRQGMNYTVNSRHMLSLRRNPGKQLSDKWVPYNEYGDVCNIPIKEFASKSQKFWNTFSGYRHQGVEFKSKSVTISPYWLGLWLGDGNNHNTGISSKDDEIVEEIYKYAKELGLKVTINQNKSKTCPTYTLSIGNAGGRNPLISLMKGYNLLKNKHVPFDYSRNSKNVRLQLLAGLIDSDGYYKKGVYSFTLKDKQLIDDIEFIAHSLGFKTRKHQKIRKIKSLDFQANYWYISIYGNVDVIPCKLKRKQAIDINKNKDPYITSIKEIKYKGIGQYYGFELDGDHLFILEDGTVTHNSFDISSLAEHEFIFYPASEVIVSASSDFFAKELWFKINLGLNSVHDELRPNLLTSNRDYMESGMKWTDPDTSKQKTIGYRSKMHRVVYDNEPGRTRGTRPNIHIFEEMGSWSGAAKLIDCYNQTEASWWRGSKFTCFPVLIGTGGQMKQGGSEDAKVMFEDPEAFNLKAFEYQYTEEKTGKFFPAFVKFGGFYEKTGVSDQEGAKKWLQARREKKKKNVKTYQQEIQEFPFNPEEAFQISGSNIFDYNLLYNRYKSLRTNAELKAVVQKGNLKFVRNGSTIVGVEWEQDDENGIFEIVEHPHIDSNTHKPVRHLYVSGCDSFDAVAEEDADNDNKSKGSIFVYKRFWKATETGNMFVAKITQRTNDATKFYWNTVKLNMYYGCKMLYEHTKIGIAQHYITNKLHHMLYERPKLDSVGVIKKQYSTNTYGVTMPIQIKQHAIMRLAQYYDNNLEVCYFASQILDAMEFKWKSNKHDETMAASIAILADDDMYQLSIQENKKSIRKFPTFVLDRRGKPVLQ
jgi:hypothetical protein